MISMPWAVLLCKFNDDDHEPYERLRYEEIFTSVGSGKNNLLDYFRDMSHGQLSLTGSQVFGWYTLNSSRADYTGSGLDWMGRMVLIGKARQAAFNAGVDLLPFFGVVVCLNVETDSFMVNDTSLYRWQPGVVCDDDGANRFTSSLTTDWLSFLMAWAYGLAPSRAEGSTADFMDPWDIMGGSPYRAPHPNYTALDSSGQPVFRIGPGLNAANMWSRNWLDETRVWDAGNSGAVNTVVQLRPLHRPELPGFLAIRFQDYFVEFRTKERWDAGIPAPTVLVHRFEDGHSYLVPDSNGHYSFGPGSYLGTPDNASLFGSKTGLEVTAIDPLQQLATIRLINAPANVPQYFPEDRPFRNPGVAWAQPRDLSDALVVLDRRAITVSRRSPSFRLLESIALYESSSAIRTVSIRDAIRRETLAAIGNLSQELLTQQKFKVPAPGDERR
jgi:hypothetical protein